MITETVELELGDLPTIDAFKKLVEEKVIRERVPKEA